MPYRVHNPKATDNAPVDVTAETKEKAWRDAIDAWKGTSTYRRPVLRQRAFEAMTRLGYVVEKV